MSDTSLKNHGVSFDRAYIALANLPKLDWTSGSDTLGHFDVPKFEFVCQCFNRFFLVQLVQVDKALDFVLIFLLFRIVDR